MKTKLLFIALLAGASLFTYAQSLVLMHDGIDLEPNEVMQVIGEATATELVIELDVKNTKTNVADSINVYVQLYENPLFTGHVGTFCWAGLCYPPFVGLSPNGVYIHANSIHENDFSGHLNPNGNIGTSVIAYTFFDVNNPNDSVQVVVQYLAGTVGIADLNKEKLEVSTYPNPATDVLNFNINSELNDVKTYELLNITGSVVRSEATQQNKTKFNVSDLAEGLYIYRVSSEKEIIKTGRVVIKH